MIKAYEEMPGKDLFHQWRETVSSRRDARESFSRMHLAVLPKAVRRTLNPRLLLIQFEIHDFVLCELKGHPPEVKSFALPVAETGVLWLCLQFHGETTFSSGYISQPETMFSFTSGAEAPLTLAKGKQWVLLLGISGVSKQQLLSELPPLRDWHDEQPHAQAAYIITYGHRQLLDDFSKQAFGPFTTPYRIGQLLAQLYTAYTQQLEKPREPSGEQTLIFLYHQAMAYIQQHYMDEGLNRETVAAECNCSVRQLTRAFEGRSVTFKAAVLTLRLHKAKELLREDPERAIEEIAVSLHFSDAKHLTNQYRRQFHRSPREERKAISPRN